MSTPTLATGQKIELNDGRTGIIRFLGTTAFQTGDWAGVELEEDSGKNDGSVQGQRYFDCEQNYGIFCRPSAISQILEAPAPVAVRPKPASNGVAAKSRPASMQAPVNGTKRQSSINGPGRRASAIVGTPTPAGRQVSGIRSPVKSPTKQLGIAPVAGSSSTTAATTTSRRPLSGTVTKGRPSVAPSATAPNRRVSTVTSSQPSLSQKGSRTSLVSTPTSRTTTTARPVPGRTAVPPRPGLSARPGPRQRLSSKPEESPSDGEAARANRLSSHRRTTTSSTNSYGGPDEDGEASEQTLVPPPIPPIPADRKDRQSRARRPSSPTAASVQSQRTIRSTAASTRQIEDLETKIRLLERKRVEERELRQGMEQAQQERDQFKNIIEKLQSKYRPQQQELEKLRQEIVTYETRFKDVEQLQEEHEQAMEIALLDREVAEETAEGLRTDLEFLRSKNEEMSLELEILREENGELSKEMSPEERTSAGWMQLQKSNDRLRQALLSLRDLAQDKEEELKGEIEELETQVKEFEPVQAEFQDTRDRLLRSEDIANDLRQQLDAALGAEEMIETLTEENMNLRDRVNELSGVIEDLESLKELNDELEINHIEAEKQLQEEIDFKDSLLIDREKSMKEQQTALDEADYNINRFRALVTALQGDLQDLEASRQISETEAAELSNRSRAVMDLNKKLQTTAAKTQVKAIDLELRKLEAEQASEHLAIVQLFLPEVFDTERDSVLAFLRFKRISYKANMVQSFVKERIASFGSTGRDEEVFAACESLEKLAWIAAMADRFVNSVSSCSVEDFTSYGSALYELEVVERTLNDYVDCLRREDVRESEMAIRFGRSIEVMTHLAGVNIGEDLPDHADDLLMRTSCLQSKLESATSALTLTKTLLEQYLLVNPTADSDVEHENVSDASIILQRLKAIIESVRSAKVVAGKAHRSLAELEVRSLTLDTPLTEHFESAERVALEVVLYTCQTGANLQELFGEEGRNEHFRPSEVAQVLSQSASEIFSLSTAEPGPYTALAGRLRDLTNLLLDLSILPTDLDNTVEFERAPAPWLARAEEVKKKKVTSVDTEAELARTRDTVRERDSILQEKETELEEQSVRIEMLEARMKDASKRSARIGELERSLHDARDAERKLKADLSLARHEAQQDAVRAQDEISRLTDERKRSIPHHARGDDSDSAVIGPAARLSLKHQEHKILGLESALRFLTHENARLRLPAPDSPLATRQGLDWLHTDPLLQQPPKPVQASPPPPSAPREADRLLEKMLFFAARPGTVDLTAVPPNKLAWRPAKHTSRWQVERRNEEWLHWKQWRQDLIHQASVPLMARNGPSAVVAA